MRRKAYGMAQLAFGSAIITLLVVALFSYRAMTVAHESDRLVRHTHRVLQNLHELLFAVGSMESNTRGFVLTTAKSYFEAYRANIKSAEQRTASIRDLTADNPAQMERLAVIERLIADKIEFSDMTTGTIPTVILTTSDAEADIVRSYELHANCYSNKPVQLREFDALVKSIRDFWMTKARLPDRASNGGAGDP